MRFALGLALVSLLVAWGSGGAVGEDNVETSAPNSTHFAAFPAVGEKASRPTTGKLVVAFRRFHEKGSAEWNVFADGRVIWQRWTSSGDAKVAAEGVRRLDTGYVVQRLTRQGVQLLRSKILATGLFEDDHSLQYRSWFSFQVRRNDDHLVTVSAGRDASYTHATPDQNRALAQSATLVADLAAGLPAEAWADRQIRGFVPAHYWVAFDRGYPDLSKMPSPARKELSRYTRLRRTGGEVLATRHARALLEALVESGISPQDNHADNIGFNLSKFGHASYLHLSPALPGDGH